jgi:ribose 5-phosphate isomerase B
MSFTVAVASDHAGFAYKTMIAAHLTEQGYDVLDLGTYSPDRVDYPDFGKAIGEAVATGEARFGVAVCGSGIGICIAANKVPGVRAGTVHDVTSARLAREHNDANVMCVGERFLGEQVVLDCVDAFLVAEFQGGRHTARVAKLG